MSFIDRLPDAATNHKAFADHMREGSGLVEINECDICGNLSWHCTHRDKPDGYVVRHDGHCMKCAEINMRAPEVYSWMIRVVAMLGRDIKRAAGNGSSPHSEGK